MSLIKQMNMIFFCVLLFIFLGTLLFNVNNTRQHLEYQLRTHAQDTATSLGLSLSPHLTSSESAPILETMINAIFDRGFYKSIVLKDRNNRVIVDRTYVKEGITNVPTWFKQLFPVDTPIASTQVNDGWQIAAQLEVKSNPNYGYIQLWENAKQSFAIFSSSFALSLLFVWLLVNKVINVPLNAVVKQADSIQQQKFEEIQTIPKTKELAKIVNALNSMSVSLQKMFSSIVKQSEKYRNFAFVDSVTHLGNRRAFVMALERRLHDKSEHHSGYILVVKATSLTNINNSVGKPAGDEYLKMLVEVLGIHASQYLEVFSMFRMSGSEIALLTEGGSSASVESIATNIIKTTKSKEKNEHKHGVAHVGITAYNSGNDIGDLMTQIDSALTVAFEKPSCFETSNNVTTIHSTENWQILLKNLINEPIANFAYQPVKKLVDNQILYTEYLARLKSNTDAQYIPISQLSAAAAKLDLSTELDKLIVTELLNIQRNKNERFGLNLSRFSILDDDFIGWLITKLTSESDICKYLTIEIPERTLIHGADRLIETILSLKSLEIRITIEHFGAQLAGIKFLKAVKPHFIKIDGMYIRNIDIDSGNQLFVNSLIALSHSLSIEIIAEFVETEEEYKWLKLAGVDHVQGFFIAPPVEINR